MEHYSGFSAADFARDEAFLRWVKHPGLHPSEDQRWDEFLSTHPHKREEVEEARLMILAILGEKQALPDDEKQQRVWERILASVPDAEMPERSVSLWSRWYSKAAAFLIILGTGWGVSEFMRMDTAGEPRQTGIALVKQVNNAELPRTIVLGDGSSIVLQPKSSLEYPETFAADKREVYLTGEGFFEVKKDATRPFLVYAGEIVTRVLGTSFTVRNDSKDVLVQVKTGKVSVFKEKQEEEAIEGVVLMPNQQVVYQHEEKKMTKSLVENPSVLVPVAKQEFEFSDTPVKEVFRVIEQAYGVDIVYDEEVLADCYLNASLNDVPLYDKLKLICKGINTTYEIIDSHIIIYGKGCKE